PEGLRARLPGAARKAEEVVADAEPAPVAGHHRALLEQLAALAGGHARQELPDGQWNGGAPGPPAAPAVPVEEGLGELDCPRGVAAPAACGEQGAGQDPQQI